MRYFEIVVRKWVNNIQTVEKYNRSCSLLLFILNGIWVYLMNLP